jgi:hypothetical protein
MVLRDRALVELLYGTGIRIGELVALDVRDVELAAREVRVMGKGRKERVVPIPEQARLALAAWLDVRRHAGVLGEPLFISLRPRREESPRRLAAREARRILGERATQANLSERVRSNTCVTSMIGRIRVPRWVVEATRETSAQARDEKERDDEFGIRAGAKRIGGTRSLDDGGRRDARRRAGGGCRRPGHSG